MPTRWFPGHYLQATEAVNRTGIDSTKAAFVAGNANFVGYQVSIWWGQTETSQGDYSALYSQLDAARSIARANNKKIFLRLFERSFAGWSRPDPFPAYIKNYTMPGGTDTFTRKSWYDKSDAIAFGNSPAMEDIVMPKIWIPGFVRERFLLWCEAVATYVANNPEFVGLGTEEYTASGAWRLPDYSADGFDSLWREFASRVRAKSGDGFVYVNTGWSTIYAQNDPRNRSLMNQLIDAGAQVFGPSDLRKDNNDGSATLSTDFGSFMFNPPSHPTAPGYAGQVGFLVNYEWPDYGSVESPAEHLRWAVDDLGIHVICWDPDRGSGTGYSGNWYWTDALNAVNGAFGRINTAVPTSISTGGAPVSWDGKKLPDALASGASMAADAVSAGSKETAYLTYLQTQIGSYVRQIYRSGTKVWEASVAGSLPVSNRKITLPGTATQTFAQYADITTGEWVHYIRSVADPAKYIATAIGRTGSGLPGVLDSSPVPGSTLQLGTFIINPPSMDSAVQTSDWLQALRDSMTVRSVTERIDNGSGVMVIEAHDGSQIPFPDSYATMVSYDTIAASLSGQPTGSPGGDPMFFANGYDGLVIWGWFGAKRGHASTQSRIRVSDMGAAILRKSTGQWVIPFRGMRGLGYLYPYLNAPGQWAVGQDTSTDSYATYLAPVNGQTIEVWPLRTPASLPGYSDFTGLISRELYADMAAWVIVLKVRVEGPDRALSRFIGCIGCDIFRSDHAGRRYWPTGLPQYVADAGGSEWQNIRNDGQDQWIVAPGCFELGNFQGNRPPWGNWGGRWPYADPPRGLNWAGFVANPPPDLRA